MKKIIISFTFLILFCYSGLIKAQTPLDEAKKLTLREQYAQAEDAFKKLMVSDPGIGDVYYFYGDNEIKAFFSDTITLTESGTIQKCKKIFNLGIEKDAVDPLNYVGLARLDFIAGKKSGVTEYVTKVNSMIPPMNTKIKRIQDPIKYALVLTQMAKIYIVQGKTDTASALPLLRRAALADPKNADLFITMGDAYLDVRDVNNAIMNYNIAQSLDPNSPMAKFRIGYLYVRAKNLKASILSLEEALKIDPNFAPAYRELGFVYSLAGQTDKSRKNYQKYLELSGNNIPAKISYVITLFKSGDYKECITQINEIFKVDSSINSMNRVVGYCYYEVKNYERGNFYLSKFLNNINNDPNLVIPKDYIYHGRILGELGRADQADEKLRTAIKFDPDANVSLYSDIATYQNKAKNYKKAIAAMEDKSKVKPLRLNDYFSLGKYYFSDGNYDKSNKTFDILLSQKELSQNDPKIKDFELSVLNYQAAALSNIDTALETGLAKPVYEKMITKSLADTVKAKTIYSKYLVDAYSYLGSYYMFCPIEKDFGKAKKYFLKVLAIDPKNDKANRAMTHPDIKKAKLPEE